MIVAETREDWVAWVGVWSFVEGGRRRFGERESGLFSVWEARKQRESWRGVEDRGNE